MDTTSLPQRLRPLMVLTAEVCMSGGRKRLAKETAFSYDIYTKLQALVCPESLVATAKHKSPTYYTDGYIQTVAYSAGTVFNGEGV